MDNIRSLLSIRRIDRMMNARVRDVCYVKRWMKVLIKEFYGGLATLKGLPKGWSDSVKRMTT